MPIGSPVARHSPGGGIRRREFGPRLAERRQRVERGIAIGRYQLWIGHPYVADHAGGRDMRLVKTGLRGPVLGGEGFNGIRRLDAASLDPFRPAIG